MDVVNRSIMYHARGGFTSHGFNLKQSASDRLHIFLKHTFDHLGNRSLFYDNLPTYITDEDQPWCIRLEVFALEDGI